MAQTKSRLLRSALDDAAPLFAALLSPLGRELPRRMRRANRTLLELA